MSNVCYDVCVVVSRWLVVVSCSLLYGMCWLLLLCDVVCCLCLFLFASCRCVLFVVRRVLLVGGCCLEIVVCYVLCVVAS